MTRAPRIERLCVVYDLDCPLCVRCALWLSVQPAYVEVEILPGSSAEARARYGAVPWLGEELVVVSEHGEVWVGAAAFLVALWALRDYRAWSYRLSGALLAPLARRFFEQVSHGRHALAALLRHAECPDGRCRLAGRDRSSRERGPYR